MRMQLCNIELLLGGDRNQTIVKHEVSVAEIVVLEAIHGEGSVTNIDPCRQEDREPKAEFARLAKRYSPNPMSERGRVVERLFPGHSPQLPATMEDIGRGDSGKRIEDPEAQARAVEARAAEEAKVKAEAEARAAEEAKAKVEAAGKGDAGEDDNDPLG